METLYQNIHEDIINRCKLKDSKAQFQLYKLYYKAMYNTSLRIVQDTMEAEDIMQDSFLTAFEKIDLYGGNVSFGAWLKRIVINNSIDSVKKNRMNVELTDEMADDLKEEENDHRYSDDEQMLEKIKKAIASLADGYRIILTLYLIEGYDHEEIGEIMGITSSTSRSQLTRARKKLVEIITDEKIVNQYE